MSPQKKIIGKKQASKLDALPVKFIIGPSELWGNLSEATIEEIRQIGGDAKSVPGVTPGTVLNSISYNLKQPYNREAFETFLTKLQEIIPAEHLTGPFFAINHVPVPIKKGDEKAKDELLDCFHLSDSENELFDAQLFYRGELVKSKRVAFSDGTCLYASLERNFNRKNGDAYDLIMSFSAPIGTNSSNGNTYPSLAEYDTAMLLKMADNMMGARHDGHLSIVPTFQQKIDQLRGQSSTYLNT